ncbi:MAG TPA: hypothetical protein DEB31_05980 [Clostridiales bacterium]|nr:hypothetical protein [Clostridiales bacterium]
MKRVLLFAMLALVFTAVFALAACSPNTQPAAEQPQTTQQAAEQQPEATPETSPEEQAAPAETPQAGEAANTEPEEMEDVEGDELETMTVIGPVTGINVEAAQMTISNEIGSQLGEEEEVVALIDENTVLIDAQTGASAALEDVEEGSFVVAYVSAAMTRSMPPQVQAYTVIVNVPESGMDVTAGDVTQTEDGNVIVIGGDEDVVVTTPEDVDTGMFGEEGETAPADGR